MVTALANPRYFKRDNQKSSLFLRPSIGGHGLVAEIMASASTARSLRTQIDAYYDLPDYDADPETFELGAEAALAVAAPEIVDAIHAVRGASDRLPSMFLVRGLQLVDSPVTTPLDGIVRQADVAVEAGVLAGVMRHFGLSGTAFATENKGRLLRAVCPVAEQSGVASSQGAAADLTNHVDNGNHRIAASNDVHPIEFPLMNSHQCFVTVTPNAAVPMRVKLNDDVFARFDPRSADPAKLEQFNLLFEALYSFASPPSHGEIRWIDQLPVLVRRNDARSGFAMRFHGDTTCGSTPASTEALDLLKRAIAITPEEIVHTRRGDVLGYLNNAATHRREPFRARFDGTDRYYLRVYGNPSDEVARWSQRMGPNGRTM